MTSNNSLPSRAPGVVSRAVGNEFVVIEPQSQTAHALAGLAAEVWRALETGSLPAAPDEDVSAIVADLAALGLIDSNAGMSRRSMLKRTGIVVAGAGIASIVLPEAIAAASPVVGFQNGKTTPGAIAVDVPANGSNTARVLKCTILGAGGGAGGGTLGGPGGEGASFTFTITQPANGPAFTLKGWVGAGGPAGSNGGVAPAQSGTFAANGGNGGQTTVTAQVKGAAGGGATYLTDSAGKLVAVAAAGGGGGSGASGTTTNGSNTIVSNVNGGKGGTASQSVANSSSNSNSGAAGSPGTDNDTTPNSVYNGVPGTTQATTTVTNGTATRTVGTGGAGGVTGQGGTAGAAGTVGAGGDGGAFSDNNHAGGSGGGGGGGFAGGGGGGSGSDNPNGKELGGGAGGAGGSNFLAQTTDAFVGFAVSSSGALTVGKGTSVATGDGANGSFAIVTVP